MQCLCVGEEKPQAEPVTVQPVQSVEHVFEAKNVQDYQVLPEHSEAEDQRLLQVGETPQQISRVWGNWGEYTLDPYWRNWALSQLGVGEVPIRVDLFSEPWSAAADLYITREMDAFSFDWGALQEGTQELLWANPPFGMIGRVAEKLLTEPVRLAMCTPEWDTETWWRELESIPHQRVYFPVRRRLFFGGYRKTALPQVKAWRTVMWLFDNRACKSKEGSRGKSLAELREALAKVDRVQWSHGYRGGKPMIPNKVLPLCEEKATATDEEVAKPKGVEFSTQTEWPGARWIDHPLSPAPFCDRIDTNLSVPERAAGVETNVRTLDNPSAPLTGSGSGLQMTERDNHPLSKEVVAEEKESVGQMAHPETITPDVGRLRGGVRINGNGRHNRPPTGELEPHLRVAVVLQSEDENDDGCQAMALLDTGAEVSLIRKGLLPEHAFREATHPMQLVAANNDPVVGGDREVELAIHFFGVEEGTGAKRRLEMPTTLYEAVIEEDVILSYRWMGERAIQVKPRRHGFTVVPDKVPIWVEGLRSNPQQRANARLPREPIYINRIPTEGEAPAKPRALDMFCGRKSAAKVLEEWGYEVVTLDNDIKKNPTICTDVLKWNYCRCYRRGYFQPIVACP